MATKLFEVGKIEESDRGIIMTCFHCGGTSLRFGNVHEDEKTGTGTYEIRCNSCGCTAEITEKWKDKDGKIAKPFKGIVVGVIAECTQDMKTELDMG